MTATTSATSSESVLSEIFNWPVRTISSDSNCLVKTIAMIAIALFTCLTLGYYAYHTYQFFHSAQPSVTHQEGAQNDPPMQATQQATQERQSAAPIEAVHQPHPEQRQRDVPPQAVEQPQQALRQGGVPIDAIRLMAQSGRVDFYKGGVTDVFGNFFERPLTVDGRQFYTSEAAFHAEAYKYLLTMPGQQGLGEQIIAELQAARDGDAALDVTRRYSDQKRNSPNWVNRANPTAGRNYQAMYEVLLEKFSDPELRAALLATGDAYLNEHNPVVGRDAIWSDNYDGTGLNLLGTLLMYVRQHCGGTGVVPPRAPSPHVCGECHVRKRYIQQQTVHTFCDRRCEMAYQNAHPGMYSYPRQVQPGDQCILPGCSNVVWLDPHTGAPHPFCGRTHAGIWQQID